MTTRCSVCLPRPIPLSRPLPLRWASIAWEDISRVARWFVTQAPVVHLRPWAHWGSGRSGLQVEPGCAPAQLTADDAAALGDRLLQDIGAPEWLRDRASTRRAAAHGPWAAGHAALDQVMMKAGRGWW